MGKKKQHGGSRKGAGRKPAHPEGKAVVVTASVPEGLVAKLDAMSAKNDWNRSAAVTEAIRRLVSAKRR
ncbi:MAG: ribbon-helix-helix protein, CopG family [Planctomycetes bacterium]|nr:ribbon-helix-helix protein, CopG family [Planctomycetota bacterium]